MRRAGSDVLVHLRKNFRLRGRGRTQKDLTAANADPRGLLCGGAANKHV